MEPTETYYTRPMPGGWSRPRDVRQLADSRAEFEFDIPVAELPGMAAELPATVRLHARLEFGRDQGQCMARIALRGELELTCQRCMQPLAVGLETDSRVALVASDAAAEAVPEGWETYLAADGMLLIPALLAEEVLLALPIVPLHADADCGAARPLVTAPPASAAVATTRPFADLKALLERGGK
ncbi:MAG: DUF177 domain-containing protein [Gammaproteobacteria bacterium]|nr:DUF177 domain-containing protein [Gammaproteobacteria bacterium]